MTARRGLVIASVTLLVAAAIAGAVGLSRVREGRQTTQALQAQIAILRAERDQLRPRVIDAVRQDPRLTGMPDRDIRVGVPASLAREIITTLLEDVPERLGLTLEDLHVRRQGEVRRIVPLGEYDLDVHVTKVTGRFATGVPEITFSENRMNIVLPIRVAAGTASAAIDYFWNSRTVGQAACGDMQFRQAVTGTVSPASYRLKGAIELSTTEDAIVLTPRVPTQRILVRVTPSRASWNAVQQALDGIGGVCGFVLDRVDVRGALEDFIGKGFSVGLPFERLKAIALPVGITSAMTIHGVPVRFSGTEGRAVITADMIWVGATVTLAPPGSGGS